MFIEFCRCLNLTILQMQFALVCRTFTQLLSPATPEKEAVTQSTFPEEYEKNLQAIEK